MFEKQASALGLSVDAARWTPLHGKVKRSLAEDHKVLITTAVTVHVILAHRI
jgi:hypothetical protein